MYRNCIKHIFIQLIKYRFPLLRSNGKSYNKTDIGMEYKMRDYSLFYFLNL